MAPPYIRLAYILDLASIDYNFMGGLVEKAIFHLAFPVDDLESTRRFYVEGLGCGLGRTSGKAMTLELGGNQMVAHLIDRKQVKQEKIYPRHFGLVFGSHDQWQALYDRAKVKALRFYRHRTIRFNGTRIEHESFFLEDPSQNLLEFKHYTFESAIFGEQELGHVGETSTDSAEPW